MACARAHDAAAAAAAASGEAAAAAAAADAPWAAATHRTLVDLARVEAALGRGRDGGGDGGGGEEDGVRASLRGLRQRYAGTAGSLNEGPLMVRD